MVVVSEGQSATRPMRENTRAKNIAQNERVMKACFPKARAPHDEEVLRVEHSIGPRPPQATQAPPPTHTTQRACAHRMT